MARNTPSSNGESARQDMSSEEVYNALYTIRPAVSRVLAVIRWVEAGYPEDGEPALLDKVRFDRYAFLSYLEDMASQVDAEVTKEIDEFRRKTQMVAAMRSPDGPDIRIGELEG